MKSQFLRQAAVITALGASGASGALGLCVPAAAQTGNTPVQTAAGVSYVMGGVGLDERAQIERQAGSYNLRLMFAESDGAYVMPDSVVVRRGGAEVLKINDGGPLMFVNVPAGVYSVQASYKGVPRVASVQVGARTPNVVMTWPSTRVEPTGD